MTEASNSRKHPFYGSQVPGFVDEHGNFVDADFVCDRCGAKVNVQFHPSLLADMSTVIAWLDENSPCGCRGNQ